MNVNKLKGKIVENGLSVGKLADLIGIERSSMYRKLNDFKKITIGDAEKIKGALKLNDEEAYEIFLS